MTSDRNDLQNVSRLVREAIAAIMAETKCTEEEARAAIAEHILETYPNRPGIRIAEFIAQTKEAMSMAGGFGQ